MCFAFWQGTGKTTCLALTIYRLLEAVACHENRAGETPVFPTSGGEAKGEEEGARCFRVLITAFTNAAVDNLHERLEKIMDLAREVPGAEGQSQWYDRVRLTRLLAGCGKFKFNDAFAVCSATTNTAGTTTTTTTIAPCTYVYIYVRM